jgi:hypothetical protein
MTLAGFCELAALSRNTRRWPRLLTLFRTGKSARTVAQSTIPLSRVVTMV